MNEWEGAKYGLLPNMAGKHELEKIKLRERIEAADSAARDAWNAALEEAAKVAYQCDKSTHPTDVGHKIMALREEAE